MGFVRRLVCMMVPMVLPLGAARAADPPLPAALVSLLSTPEHRAALLQAAHAVDGPGIPACPDASYTTSGTVGMLEPVKTDSGGKLTAGAWKEQVHEIGCGLERTLNVLAVVGPNGRVQTSPLLPGTTIADPLLQKDSVQYAAAAMGGLPPGCEQGGVLDTKFVGEEGQPPGVFPRADSPLRPWTESWILQACAKRAVVEMHFTPDATGTAIRAAPAK